MEMIIEIGGHKLNVILGEYHPRIKGNRWEQEEEEFYDIDDVILLSDESKTYDEIETMLGTNDLWFDIQDKIFEILNDQYEKLWD